MIIVFRVATLLLFFFVIDYSADYFIDYSGNHSAYMGVTVVSCEGTCLGNRRVVVHAQDVPHYGMWTGSWTGA